MGGGKALRRRMKNAEKANVSLHKAAQGKGTAHIPLPAAPTKDDYKDKMPASLRKMLALKEVAEQPAKRRKLEHGQHAGQQQQQRSPQGQKGQQTGRGPSASQVDATQQQQPQQHQQRHKQQPDGGQQQAVLNACAAWQQPKKLKQKKKDYLNAKKLKKKGKGKAQAAAADDDMELQSDRVAFGEVVHAPPEVALKSKHWAANSKQQHQHQQQQHGSQHAGGSNKHKQQQKQRPPKQQADQGDELQQMREQLIETYRSGRPAPQEGLATLKSLKELVKKQAHG